MISSKDSIESKLKDFSDLFSKEMTELGKFCESIKEKVDDLMNATWTLIKDVSAFNKEYVGDLKDKKEADGQVFTKIENTLFGFNERLSKFDFPSTSIYQEKLSPMILLVESCFKIVLFPILDLVPRLPTNAPRSSANVSLGGEKGLGHWKTTWKINRK